jgi:hypothetical protein
MSTRNDLSQALARVHRKAVELLAKENLTPEARKKLTDIARDMLAMSHVARPTAVLDRQTQTDFTIWRAISLAVEFLTGFHNGT